MNRCANISFLRLAAKYPVFIEGDNVWVQNMPGNPTPKRLCSFSSQFKGAQTQPNGVVESARIQAQHMHEISFCIRELIPYLRSLSLGDRTSLVSGEDIERDLKELNQLSGGLIDKTVNTSSQAADLQVLLKLFCVPCVLAFGQIIPLQRIVRNRRPRSSGLDGFITINNTQYAYLQQSRSLREIIGLVDLLFSGIQPATPNPLEQRRNNDVAGLFLQSLERLFARLGGVNMGGYRRLYHDQYHEIQYNRGHLILVRGPVTHRRAPRNMYVGIRIIGNQRAQWSRQNPILRNVDQSFWKADGTPETNNLCMGNPGQYSWLFSNEHQLTDAESIVQWLDAGVINATGISMVQQAFRRTNLPQLRQNLPGMGRRLS